MRKSPDRRWAGGHCLTAYRQMKMSCCLLTKDYKLFLDIGEAGSSPPLCHAYASGQQTPHGPCSLPTVTGSLAPQG